MIYDEYGYIAHRPLRPEAWGALAGQMPPGRVIINHTLPPGMLVIENFLSPQWCAGLAKECETAKAIPHTVASAESDAGNISTTLSDIRRSELIDIRSLKVDVEAAVRQIFSDVIAPHYNAKIEWFERPEIIRYREGGTYVPHADSENWIAGEKRWKRMVDRDLSILIYLNEEFEGGEIEFSNFGMSLAPKRGMLVAFPSDHRYIHTAKTVTSGVRYAIVSWAGVVGGPRGAGALTPNVIKM